MPFSKLNIFGAPIESKGPGMVSSFKIREKPALRAGLIMNPVNCQLDMLQCVKLAINLYLISSLPDI